MIKPNVTAEQAVIGDILLSAETVMPAAVEKLTPDDFFVPEYRALFTACRVLYRQQRPIDVVTVIGSLGDEYKPTVIQAGEAVPSISGYQQYIDLVLETAQKIRAHRAAADFLETLEGNQPLDECQGAAANVLKCFDSVFCGKTVTAADGFFSFCEGQEKPKRYIQTGFSGLDRLTHISKGDYIVIGGRPSTGKTAITLQFMLHMAEQYKAVYFSLETSSEKIYERLISCYTHTSFAAIKSGAILWDNVTPHYDAFKRLQLTVVEAAGWTVDQIKSKAMQLQADVIFIDYLGLIKSEGRSGYEKVTNISISLHTLAQQCKIAVMALCQLNRSGDDEPDMTSLRDSGQIEQDADCILLMHTDDPKDPQADRKLIIAKNKEGQVGIKHMRFDGAYQTFTERTNQYD